MDYSGNVFLVGPMGVGKTTIGRALAERMNLEFFDSDQEIEAATGADIPWIFDVEGEQGFRHREVKMINLLSGRKNIVLATGGGAVLDKKNRKRLKKRGLGGLFAREYQTADSSDRARQTSTVAAKQKSRADNQGFDGGT